MYTQFESVEAGVGEDRLSATLRGKVMANSIFIDQSKVVPGDKLSANMLSYNDPMRLLKAAKSFGAALDLGVEVKVCQDHLKISAAVTDLGFIKWHASTNYSAAADYNLSFEGYDIDAQELKTEFDGTLVAAEPSSQGYFTMLNASLNVGVEYNFLRNHFAIGVMSHTEYYNKQFYTELTASLNIRATNGLSATVSHTFLANNRLGVLGAALNIHPCAINIFIGADFIDTRYVKYKNIPVPRYQNSLNLYVGVGFNLARPKFMKQAEREMCVKRRSTR